MSFGAKSGKSAKPSAADPLNAPVPAVGAVSILPGVPLPPGLVGGSVPEPEPSVPVQQAPAPAMVQAVSAFTQLADPEPQLVGAGAPATADPGAGLAPTGFQPVPIAAVGMPVQSVVPDALVHPDVPAQPGRLHPAALLPRPHIAPPGETLLDDGEGHDGEGHHRRTRRPLWGRKRPAVAAAEPELAEPVSSVPPAPVAASDKPARRGPSLTRKHVAALAVVGVVAVAGGGYYAMSGDSSTDTLPPVVHAGRIGTGVTLPVTLNGWHKVAAPGASAAGMQRVARLAGGHGFTAVYTATGRPVARGASPALVVFAGTQGPGSMPLAFNDVVATLFGAKHPTVRIGQLPNLPPAGGWARPSICGTVTSHAGTGLMCVWTDPGTRGVFYIPNVGKQSYARLAATVRGSVELTAPKPAAKH